MSENEVNEYKEQRLSNLHQLEEMGYSPFGEAFKRTGRLCDVRAGFEEGGRVTAAGRLVTVRD
ncbi:MAG: lysine--tRNA ligase, partial [Kiritimatiellae bacterium]|nr:lysine--tRNA ligase [Kiritimatiellia bacterium]